MGNTLIDTENTEIVSTWRGSVVVTNSNTEIPTDAHYITIEENPRRYVQYTKHMNGTLGHNPRLIVATILPYVIAGIPAIKNPEN